MNTGYTIIRQIKGGRETALKTLLVLQRVVGEARYTQIEELLEIVKSVGSRLVEAQPKGTVHTHVNLVPLFSNLQQ